MAEEPSAKRYHGETSDQTSKVDDVQLPDGKYDYTTKLKNLELHGKETLEVVCTSNLDEADEMIRRLRMRGGDWYPSFFGVDVEFTREDEPSRRAVVLQLCMEELYLVYHVTAAKEWPKHLHKLLEEEKLYKFVGFRIEGDKKMLKNSGLEINPKNFIDIQCEWRVPYTGKKYDSLADVASIVIHPFYDKMKRKINKEEDHKLWGISPLPENLIEYAAIDVYATYESWKNIDNIKAGLERAKREAENPHYDYDF